MRMVEEGMQQQQQISDQSVLKAVVKNILDKVIEAGARWIALRVCEVKLEVKDRHPLNVSRII